MKTYSQEILENVQKVGSESPLSRAHKVYLNQLRKKYSFVPNTIYDIGSCVLHWAKEAKNTWPESNIILFDGTDIFEKFYKDKGYTYNIDVLSSEDDKWVDFYQNNNMFAGNSYYRENPQYSNAAATLYDESSIIKLKTKTLDTVVKNRNFEMPQLIKIDVQGAELDVLMGAKETLKSCQHLIIELRNVEYNIGSPEKETVIDYLKSIGFSNKGLFCNNGPDGDYHFINNLK